MHARILAVAGFRASVLLLGVLCGACADEPVPGNPPPPAECPFDENSRFTFTSVGPHPGASNSPICPNVDPDVLNTQADAGTQACEITQKDDCRADVACQVMGVDIKGEMAALEDGIFGDFDVFVPGLGKVCSYEVQATVK